jgi:hypothetical protein
VNHEIFAGKDCPISLWITGFIPHMNKTNYFTNRRGCQARSSLYANTQLRAHRRAEKKIKSKKNKINKE